MEYNTSKLRRYIMEYTIIALCCAVVTLFGLYYNLNEFVVKTVMSDKVRTEIIIEKNTEAINLLISNRK